MESDKIMNKFIEKYSNRVEIKNEIKETKN